MEALILKIFFCLFVMESVKTLLLPNIALKKPAWQSSTYSDITVAGKAVDGLKSDLSHSSGQCAISATGQSTAEWRVDLGDISSINHITIYYRTDNYPWVNNGLRETYLGFSVYVSNTTIKDEGQICFHDNGHFILSTIPPELTLNCTLHGRYVIFYNERIGQQPQNYSKYAETNICEFEVYGCRQNTYGENCMATCPGNCLNDMCELVTGNCFQCEAGYQDLRCDNECDGGMYGQDCRNTCGACINNTQCQHINGSCLQGCGPGYQGDKCDKECPFGTYGNDCISVCSTTCSVANICNKTTGECVGGCKPGWKGFLCQQECDGGTYGHDCSNICGACINNTQCNHINGNCVQGCAAGYQGDKCDNECPFGEYGFNCTSECSDKCAVPRSCNKTTGECLGGCQPGWKEQFCVQECDNGVYGLDCNSPCGFCINNTHCHHITGECPWGCTFGFQGIRCNEASHAGVTCDTCESYVIIAVVISIFVIIMGTILNIVIWRRKKKNCKNESYYENTAREKPDVQGHNKQSTYSELGELAEFDKQNTYDDIHHYTNANFIQQ